MTRLYTDGVNKVYETDFETQKHYLTVLCKELRNMEPEALYDFKAFFVPNQDYLATMFGKEAEEPLYDLYDFDGRCHWHGYIMVPVENIVGDVVGFVGYDALTRIDTIGTDKPRGVVYKYSSNSIFKRSNYIHVRSDVYLRALREGYIFAPDGTFDMINSVANGINACSMFGSYVNDCTAAQLKFIDRVYVPVDNDDAGERLGEMLRGRLGCKTIIVRQNKFKDLDDVLKSEYKETYLKQIRTHIADKSTHNLYVRLK